ncbi:type II CRISPR-associated endonuclease Cas1 [Marivita sp. GX14005]|nr:type II CRISPR-associated endonuclease Cas1 [Marivita sp. GX14005]
MPVTILGPNFAPVAVVLPLNGHGEQGYRMADQAAAPKPLRKQVWARLVRHKIAAQAAVLDRLDLPSERLHRLTAAVHSGDPANREAQAAQAYWPLLLGKGSRRDTRAEGTNALLNYGYAVLRAATARAIVSAGLHPSLSVHHRSGGDALALADDLMEPFRPTIDLTVHALLQSGVTSAEDGRADLVETLIAPFSTDQGRSPLSQVLFRLAQGVAASFTARKADLAFPRQPIPEDDPADA